jgi:hypothetical protein
MAEFAQCSRSLDVLFLLDQSGSVSVENWKKEIEFAAQLSEGLAKIYHNVHFGVIVFGPAPGLIPRPLSNVSSEVVSGQIRALPGCQQFFNPEDRDARTCTTPTNQAIATARKQFELNGRKDTSRVVFLITDGKPETGIFLVDKVVSQPLANETLIEAAAAKKQGISIVTVGIALDNNTQQLMNQIASNPPEDYSYPNVTSFDELIIKLPTILASSCFYISDITPAVGCSGDTIAVIGENLFATDAFLKCRFTFLNGEHSIVRGHHWNNTLMHCVVPDRIGMVTSAIVEVTTDGRGFTDNGFTFQYATTCDQQRDDNATALGVVPVTEASALWWPWLFFLLLPLLCCLLFAAWCWRRRKPKEKQQRTQAVPTQETVPEEEAFQIEGLDTSPVPPASPQKWRVQPAAYIGFGKGKMDVNWNGEAPESAPHALKREQIPANTLENPVEGTPLTSGSLAYVAEGSGQAKKRRCCPWLCCVGVQDEPQYPRTEGEVQHLAVPRVIFHADSGHVHNTTLEESKNDVQG